MSAEKMPHKEFRFQGLDARTEWKTALLLFIPAIVIMLGFLFLLYHFFPQFHPLSATIGAGTLTATSMILLHQQLVKRIKDRTWTIIIDESDMLEISFQQYHYRFPLTDLVTIKNLGNVDLRYLTLMTKTAVIKIRVGNAAFASFSSTQDIQTLDTFIAHLKPYLDQHFNTKILRNRITPPGFPNYGVYVVKTEQIRYSLLNKLEAWQVILLVFVSGVLLLVSIMLLLEHFFLD
ncbi:hypothetical protein [Pedobacter sp. KLB.chiD]|uniref:hypothetical protein n=1 Tax=Pedobacter sp. KLB.chiD TaxID=3387402 RepID=UPI00399AA4CE